MPSKLSAIPPYHLFSCPCLLHEEAPGAGLLSLWHWLLANIPFLTHSSCTGRDPQENLEALEEFKEFTRIKGLVPENLVIPEQMGENICNPCSPLCPL